MRVTSKGQVTIPLEVRRALGIEAGTEVDFRIAAEGAVLTLEPTGRRAAVRRLRGAGAGHMSTDEILALTRS